MTGGPLTGVIAALPAEARTARRLRRLGWRVVSSGVGAERARAAARALLDGGAGRLLAWGTAGALQPGLRPGTLILASEVVDDNGQCYPMASAWQARLRASAPMGSMVRTGPLVTVRRAVADKQAKARLAQQTGAIAVDMETAAIARLAADHAVPFAVVRTIVDPLEQALPQAVLLTGPGRFFALRVGLRLAIHPRDLAQAFALGGNMRVAKAGLIAMARRLAETVDDC